MVYHSYSTLYIILDFVSQNSVYYKKEEKSEVRKSEKTASNDNDY